MSFILDALRKSDQQRQRSATPTLTTAQTGAAEPRQAAPLWYLLIAAVLLGAGILIGWMHQTPPETAALAPAIGKPVEARAQPFPPEPFPAVPEAVRKPELQLPSKPEIPIPPTAPANPVSGDALRDVVALAELPPAIRQEIPKVSILAHSYSSKPKARFVFINDRMVHEDEYPVPGLKLEQITADGMIFNYKGYRFHRPAIAEAH